MPLAPVQEVKMIKHRTWRSDRSSSSYISRSFLGRSCYSKISRFFLGLQHFQILLLQNFQVFSRTSTFPGLSRADLATPTFPGFFLGLQHFQIFPGLDRSSTSNISRSFFFVGTNFNKEFTSTVANKDSMYRVSQKKLGNLLGNSETNFFWDTL